MVVTPSCNSKKTRAYAKKKFAAKCAGVAGSAKLRKNLASVVGHLMMPGSDKQKPVVQKLTKSEVLKIKKSVGKELVELTVKGKKMLEKSLKE